MFAVVKSSGFQYRVEIGSKIIIPAILGKVGDKITFADVLLLNQEGTVKVGKPYLPNIKVEGEITKVGRLAKVIVYKFIRREKYRRKQGHRQNFSEIKITNIKSSKSVSNQEE